MYGLPQRYRSQPPIPFDDTAPFDAGTVWQPDVMPYAVGLALGLNCDALIDVGCGSGRKLEPYTGALLLAGFDHPDIVAKLGPDEGFPIAALDLSVPGVVLPEWATDWRSLVVCSDVIEHLEDPEPLVALLADALTRGAARVVLSTPDRAATRGRRHMGPPPNQHHAREWALPELVRWLGGLGFVVEVATLTRSNDREQNLATCLLVLR